MGIFFFWGGLNACPDGLGHLFTATMVILLIFSNWSQSARLSAGGEGCNRYLGNDQMQSTWTIMCIPLQAEVRVLKTCPTNPQNPKIIKIGRVKTSHHLDQEAILCAGGGKNEKGKFKDSCFGDSGGNWFSINSARCHILIVKTYERSTELLESWDQKMGAVWHRLLWYPRMWHRSAAKIANSISICFCILGGRMHISRCLV